MFSLGKKKSHKWLGQVNMEEDVIVECRVLSEIAIQKYRESLPKGQDVIILRY